MSTGSTLVMYNACNNHIDRNSQRSGPAVSSFDPNRAMCSSPSPSSALPKKVSFEPIDSYSVAARTSQYASEYAKMMQHELEGSSFYITEDSPSDVYEVPHSDGSSVGSHNGDGTVDLGCGRVGAVRRGAHGESFVVPKPILKNRSRESSPTMMMCEGLAERERIREKKETKRFIHGVPMNPDSHLLPELWAEVLECTEHVTITDEKCCFPSDREFRSNLVKCKKELTFLRNDFNVNKTLLKLNILFQEGSITAEDFARKSSIIALVQMNQALQRRTQIEKEKYGTLCYD